MHKAGRDRRALCLLAFFVLLLGIGAVPVLADSPEQPPNRVPPPPPTAEQRAKLPDAKDIARGLAAVEEEEEERRAELNSPAALAEREESELAYAGASAVEASALLHSFFGAEIAALNSDPARLLSHASLKRPLEGGTAAQIYDGEEPGLLDAGIPVRTVNEAGDLQKVDLSLVESGDNLEPLNPLTEVVIPDSAAEGIDIGGHGLGITPLGVEETSLVRRFGDLNAVYVEAATDTDLLAAPLSGGVELYDQLRSVESPEVLRFRIEMPPGAELRPDGNGGAEVISDAKRIGAIPFPTAIDAQGTDVPVTLVVVGDVIELTVTHRDAGYAYPILVDPALNEDWYSANWYSGYNLQPLSDGTWSWGTNTNWVYGRTWCFYTCWGSGLGPIPIT